MMGGVPLPGGVTYIRRDLLKSRLWDSAVAAAGPAMNFILFILLALPFHPMLGWIDTNIPPNQYQPWQIFLGAMALLQIMAVGINLLPVPPLDGFNIIAPYLNPELRRSDDAADQHLLFLRPVHDPVELAADVAHPGNRSVADGAGARRLGDRDVPLVQDRSDG
jgi:hypothetical protein